MTLNKKVLLFAIFAVMILVTNLKADTSSPLAVKCSLIILILILFYHKLNQLLQLYSI